MEVAIDDYIRLQISGVIWGFQFASPPATAVPFPGWLQPTTIDPVMENTRKNSWITTAPPAFLGGLGAALVIVWIGGSRVDHLEVRQPGADGTPTRVESEDYQPPVAGEPIRGDGVPADIPGVWPAFRGPNRDAICDDGTPLARTWPQEGPPVLWRIEMGEGYASAVVRDGRVYVLDYIVDQIVEQLRGLPKAERATLAEALDGVTSETFDGISAILSKLSFDSHDEVADELGVLLSDTGKDLVDALRNNTLENVDRSTDTMRCLSLADGREIWRNSYPALVTRNHGRSRTTPAIAGDCVVSIGPRCHVACWDAETGQCRWLIDMVHQFGSEERQWYAGQCPLVDGELVILAPCGADSLLIAVDHKTGRAVWKTPNPRGWKMSHCSIMPMQFAGRDMYVYCGNGGTVGVSAEDGSLLWDETEWVEHYATSPSPVPLRDGRIFLSSGYDRIGAMMLRLKEADGSLGAETAYTLKRRAFNSEHQTPIFYNGHLYAIRKSGRGPLVCMDLDGKELWNSGDRKFEHGPYMIADGLIFALSGDGLLTTAEVTHEAYRPLAHFQVFEDGHDAWGPMAMVAGRLIVRDMTRMACLDVRERVE